MALTIKTSLRKYLLPAALIGAAFIPVSAAPIELEGDEEGDYSFYITGANFLGTQAQGAFDQNNFTNPYSRNNVDPLAIGVNISFKLYGDKSTKDIGFPNGYGAQFVISGYGPMKERYVRSVEIFWSESNQNWGGLSLYGRTDLKNPYTVKSDVSSFEEESDVKATITPDWQGECISLYEFDEPVYYIALTCNEDQRDNFPPRISAFRINFVKEWETEPQEGTTAAGCLNADTPAPELYDLNGLRIFSPQPSPGLYIERKGSEVRKILIR